MAANGEFFNIVEKKQELRDKTTKKAVQKKIEKSEYVPPPGHISFIKRGKNEDGEEVSFLIFHNGVVYQHGRTYDLAEDWFSLEVEWSQSHITTGKLHQVQVFHTTTKSAGKAMECCSTSMGF